MIVHPNIFRGKTIVIDTLFILDFATKESYSKAKETTFCVAVM